MRNKILTLLRQSGEKYISGEEIADKLGVSRTAVWKHIKEMRAQGYDIESHARSGYILREAPDALLSGEIHHGLETKIIGQEIICHEEIDSTNNEAKRLARNGAVEGTVVVAESQTGGKGRLERKFFSPKGKGIWFSVILRPKFLPQEAPKCTLMAAVAVARAMEEFGLEPGIKWPNDLLYENKKLVGILTEMSAEMDGINYIVIGTGINVNIDQSDFPGDIRDVATSLSMMKGEQLPRVKFFQAVLRAMDDLYGKVQREGFAPVLEEWRKYSITLGQEVKVIGVRDGEVYFGKAVDIDADGALLVDTAEGRQRVLAGDVSIRPRSGKW
ncbi:MAG: biotin--[acetyl-CoA-carboxylase] ligase [Selenomonas sp.]|uniref:biotin--[acetyl-CoA-carboxylase] ligase n=1 Tax=Selenomonas sp. TaxID=2053611 RepID=UPI0025D09D56|nr:biotin--[acetyl-CoA-carboxylase] ligase [Selenomonas sp.]MCR5757772.1 biotin--[acetyl-CoA-carboxylase] ligase [Selenomonas sp.]